MNHLGEERSRMNDGQQVASVHGLMSHPSAALSHPKQILEVRMSTNMRACRVPRSESIGWAGTTLKGFGVNLSLPRRIHGR